MTKIYQSMRVVNKKDLSIPAATNPFKFEIESVRYCEKAFGEEDGLFLLLKDNYFGVAGKSLGNKEKYYYGLVGQDIHNKFKKDMGIERFEELVGKDIIGFVREDRLGLDGLRMMTKVKDKHSKDSPINYWSFNNLG